MKLAAGSLLSPKKTPRPPSKHITNKHLCVLSALVETVFNTLCVLSALAGNCIQYPSWETHKKSPTICGASLYVRYND